MADTDGNLIIGIELEDGTIKKVTASAEALGKAIGQELSGTVSKGVDRSFAGIATTLTFIGNIAGKAFDAVSGSVSKAIDEATQAESALNKFNQVLANTGNYTKEASDEFIAFANSLEQVGTVSADAVIDASSSLVAIGGLTGQSLKEATQAAVDLSAGLGTDLGTSFDLVSKAAAGNTAALSRYGIKVDENIPKGERFAAALDQINARFGGLDVSRANTFAGAFTKLENSINNAFEAVGNLVTGSAPLTAIINKISEIVQRLTKDFEGLKGQSAFDALITDTVRFALTVANVLLPPLEVLYNAGVTIFGVFKTGLQAIVTLVSLAAEGWAQLGNAVGLVSDETLAGIQTFSEASTEVLSQFAEDTATSAEGIFTNFNISEKIVTALEEINAAGENADPLANVVANAKKSGDALVSSVSDFSKKLGSIVQSGIVRGISQGIQSLVSSLASGGNAFKNFSKTILNILGDLLIQVGEAIIFTGKSIEALRDSIVGAVGIPAIAAGIALIALGAALKAFTGGGATGGSAAAGAAGSTGVTAADPITAGDPNAVTRNTAQQVTIQVQGNILDRRETGLEIANVLQEYFDTNDGVVAKA